jgi:hypothetical protein
MQNKIGWNIWLTQRKDTDGHATSLSLVQVVEFLPGGKKKNHVRC